jgi:hypothetical protein
VIFAVSFCVILGAAKLFANGSPAYAAVQKHIQAGMPGVEAVPPGLMLLIYGPSLAVTFSCPEPVLTGRHYLLPLAIVGGRRLKAEESAVARHFAPG